MYSLIAGAALFVCCAYIGLGVSDWYKKRRLFFDALIDYLDALERGIKYAKTPLPKLTRDFAADKKGDLFVMLREQFAENTADGKSKSKTLLLTSYEKKAVSDMLASLGKYDTDTQLAELGRYRALFEPIRAASAKKYDTTGKLAAKLGVLAGIAVMLTLA